MTEAWEGRGFVVSGRVQGVGFRAWTRRRAMALGLRGRVWNRPDGSVGVEAFGDAEGLDALEAALGKGPLMARVTSVRRTPVVEAPGGAEFEIDVRV